MFKNIYILDGVLTDAQRDKLQVLFEKQDKQRDEFKAEMKKLKEKELAKRYAMRKTNDTEMEKNPGCWKVSAA